MPCEANRPFPLRFWRLRSHAYDLVADWVHRDGAYPILLKILNQAHARSLVLDQQIASIAGVPPTLIDLDDFTTQVGIFQLLADHVQQEKPAAPDLDYHADRIAAQILGA